MKNLLIDSIVSTARVSERILEYHLARFDLTLPAFRLYNYLVAQPQYSAPFAEVVKALGIAGPTLSCLAAKLVDKQELVMTHGDSGRSRRLRLHANALSKWKDASLIVEEIEEQFERAMGKDKMVELKNLQKKFSKELEKQWETFVQESAVLSRRVRRTRTVARPYKRRRMLGKSR